MRVTSRKLNKLAALAATLAGGMFLLGTDSLAAASDREKGLWSLQPLARPNVPAIPTDGIRVRNPIDAFVGAKLLEHGLAQAPEADRRTLIRRLYFDLIGLPPKPEEIEEFLRDPDSQAYEKLVDRLLASPRHGERWARHWLDVVHYGETHGYDKDKPRPNAWPYRDYVIRAFNEDKPYGRFVQEQIAGDVLFPFTRDGIEALGFIAAGPWDFIGHAEVPETKIDGKVARHLDRDDMVANTMQTFNSLTVQCAQCHDHKFDPITQEDYYSLQAVFAAVDRTDKKYDLDPDVARQRADSEAKQKRLADRHKEIEQAITQRAGPAYAELDQKTTALEKSLSKADAFGYHSQVEAKQDAPKWVQVDLGEPRPLSAVVLLPCKDDFNNIGEGFGFPVRFRVDVSNDEEFKECLSVVADQTFQDVPNPKLAPQHFAVATKPARFIRVTATKLAPRQNDYIFALSELEALDVEGKNLAAGKRVTALDSIENAPRWRKSNLTDGYHSGMQVGDSAELAEMKKRRAEMFDAAKSAEEAAELAELARGLADVKGVLTNLPAQKVTYAGAVHTGSGAFRGTGGEGGKPRPIFILNRGNVQQPRDPVNPGTLSCVPGMHARFQLDATHSEGERRAALARWLAGTNNPLTWRSIVNRVWQYHFGRGLVETPNDFGRMGAAPTHPELLDWLACEFRDGGQSLKALHKLIVTSAAYRQESEARSQESAQVDSDNRLLSRQNRRKLEAEAVRDAVLFVAGKLDLTMGGPSFQDFIIDKPEHSPHYEYHLHDPEDPKSHRRSIYRFIVRSQQQPFMTTLDCADPSMQVARRNESVSPLQALALLNNAFMVAMSKHFAARLDALGGETAVKARRAYEEAIGRAPTSEQQAVLTAYASEHGLANFCRVLFNLNEFSFVD